MKLRPTLLWAAVLAGGLGLWAGHRLGPVPAQQMARTPAPPAVAPVGIGERLPPLVLPDLQGASVDLRSFAGRPLLINVWASWCGPCVEEMPELSRFATAQGERGVQVVGLALDTPEAVQAFLARVPVDYPVLLETPGPADASVRLGNTQGLLPYSVLVDADGRLIKRQLGPFAPGTLDDWVR